MEARFEGARLQEGVGIFESGAMPGNSGKMTEMNARFRSLFHPIPPNSPGEEHPRENEGESTFPLRLNSFPLKISRRVCKASLFLRITLFHRLNVRNKFARVRIF